MYIRCRSIINKAIKNYFWTLSFISYLLLTAVSYGFIKDLFFYLEDYQLIHSLQNGTLYQGWPYQGISVIYYPLYLLFSNQPEGYFVVAILTYAVLAAVLALFVWQLTNCKLAAYVSGLIFASGYVGSQSMFWVMVGSASNLYLIFLIMMIIFYDRYIKSSSLSGSIILYSLFLVILVLFSHRSHYALAVIIAIDLFYLYKQRKKFCYGEVKQFFKRIIPFLAMTIIIFFTLPILFNERTESSGYLLSDWQKNIKNLIFLNDLGNFLVPSSIRESSTLDYILAKLHLSIVNISIISFSFLITLLYFCKIRWNKFIKIILVYLGLFLLFLWFLAVPLEYKIDKFLGSVIGILWLYLSIGFLVFSKIKRSYREIFTFLLLLTLISYFPFYLFESGFDHPSWHRYMIFGYAFFACLISFFIVVIFINRRKFLYKAVGLIIIGSIVLGNVILSRTSNYTGLIVDRSFKTKSFFESLTKQVSGSKGETLFYFDVVNDPLIQSTYNKIFASGIYPEETAIAAIYNKKIEDIKITEQYDDFIKDLAEGKYKNIYTFFYDQNYNLINTTKTLIIKSQPENKLILDLTSKNVKLSKLGAGTLDFFINNSFSLQPIFIKGNLGSKSINSGIEIDTNNFFSSRPVILKIKAQASIADINRDDFPYFDGMLSVKPRLNIDNLHDSDKRKILLDYIRERELFRKSVKVSSNGFEYPGKAEYAIDGDLATSWLSNKKVWVSGGKLWIQVDLPDKYTFSEIHWVSSYSTRLPVTYKYQVSDDNKNWTTIYEKNNPNIHKNEYVVDKVPKTTAKYFKMVILEATGDFPAITELEVLKNSYDIDHELANFLTEHPLPEINSYGEFEQISNNFKDILKLKVYPISDKFIDIFHSIKVDNDFYLDGKDHIYTLVLPPGGTALQSLIIQLPNIPLNITFKEISLVSSGD